MTQQIRLRHHTDGHVALCVMPGVWTITRGGPGNFVKFNDEHVSGPDWSELLVAELPEPDGRHCVNGRISPQWKLSNGHEVAALTEGVQVTNEWTEALSCTGGIGFDEVRMDALKALAAIAACERYQVEREKA